MMLLFDPDPPFVRWHSFGRGTSEEHTQRFTPEWYRNEFENMKSKKAKAIGYLLYHGGEEITEPVKLLTQGSLSKVENCVRFLPERNEMTLRIARYWMRESPEIPHVLFCDTALFAHLPAEASTYAIPYRLREEGIRRYGGDGLCHQWGWGQICGLKMYKRVVSIHLGNQTSIAALKDGKAVETSIGFTPIEGIISSNGCGDIDTAIVLQLVSAGMSLQEINQSLSRDGGFTGLIGKRCSLIDILQKNNSDNKKFVRELFSYQVMKYLGAFISVLGGVDAIVFICDYVDESSELIEEICCSLDFLRLKKREKAKASHGYWIFSENDSEVDVFCFKYDKWNILAKKLMNLINKEL
jgi:acetate kinase